MRCLFCGKELALFKRLTGGGEFCSDAHRQKYQEEYNQLALSRLLQASPTGEHAGAKNNPSKPAEGKGLLDMVGVATSGTSAFDTMPEPAPFDLIQEAPPSNGGSNGGGSNGGSNGSYYAQEDEPPAEEHQSPASQQEEAIAPADLTGFFVEVPSPTPASSPADIALSALDMIWAENLALPSSEIPGQDAMPPVAGAVALDVSPSFKAPTATSRAQVLELRETSRPLVGANAGFPVLDSVGLEATVKTMEIHILPNAPQSATLIWEEAPKEFLGASPQLGDLGRLAFATVGWEELEAGHRVTLNGVHAASKENGATPYASGLAVVDEEEVVEEPVDAILEPEVEQEAFDEPAPEEVASPEPIPQVVTKPLPMTLHGHAPSRGKPVQVFPSAIVRAAGVQVPRSTALPLRPTLLFGPAPAPAQLKPEAAPAVKPAAVAPPRPETAKVAPKPEIRTPDIKNIVKTAPTVKLPPIEKKEPPKPVAAAPVEIKPAETKPVIESRVIEPRKVTPTVIEPKGEPKGEPKVEPTAPPQQVSAPAPAQIPTPPQTEIKGRRPEIRTLTPPKPEIRKPEERKPEVKAPESKQAEPRKEEVKKPEVKPEPKPEIKEEPKKEKAVAAPVVEPKPKKEPVPEKVTPVPAPASAPESFSESELSLPHLGTEVNEGFWSKLPMAAKVSIGAALVVAVVVGALYFTKQGSTGPISNAPTVVTAGNVLSSGGSGWDTDWSPDPAGSKRQRRLNVMRASLSLSDYRMEFEGQIETKALGWVFRASNPKNFYVSKVEIVKPGLEPVIRLVHFAVIDGVEQPHTDVPLSIKVRPDTMYKIRFEAVGDRFTTWLLDQKVDEWTDSRIATGGVGLYSEAGESLSLKGGLNVAPLVVKR